MATLAPAPRPIEPHAAALLREALNRALCDERIFRVIGMSGVPGWRATGRAAVPRLPTLACGTLVRFFIIGDAMPRDMLDAAMGGPRVIPALESAGLAVPEAGGRGRCPLALTPAANVFAFSDPLEDPASMNPPDEFIIPISGAARFVDDLAVREPCGLAVDLGCGQSFHALHDARQALHRDRHQSPGPGVRGHQRIAQRRQ
jgi:hypothetical protein